MISDDKSENCEAIWIIFLVNIKIYKFTLHFEDLK